MARSSSTHLSQVGRRRLRHALAATVALAFAAILTSCATLSLVPFDPHSRGGIYAEWPPHRGAGEWWYVTGILHRGKNELWLYQFTIFHEATLLKQGYLFDLALSNYATGSHIFEEYSTTSSSEAYGRGGAIVFGKSFITLTRRDVRIQATTKKLRFHLTLVPEKPPIWEANAGIVGMGHAGRPDEMSYYYSFTRLRTTGTISYLGSAGKRITRSVEGSSWLDRQWGRFSVSGWDWFSLRLFDGRDVMLYAFPQTGFREGTLVGPRGGTRLLKQFSYTTGSWQTIDGSRYGLSWQIDLPSLGKEFHVVALAKNNYNPNKVLPYWEGLCKVYDKKGAFVGYAVEETTATAHRILPAKGSS